MVEALCTYIALSVKKVYMYRLYTEVKVNKCHRNCTEMFNQLVP